MALGARLRTVFGGRRAERDPGPVPDRLTYAVGDIHGRLDLLEAMLRRIEADRAGAPADVVFLGDYVDRGPASAGVLRFLYELDLDGARVTCLMGNHERMMLDFLADPEANGMRWLVNGGRETVASFAGQDWSAPAAEGFEQACRDVVLAAFDPAHLAWLRALPLQWRSGTLGCVHAITDPVASWEAQTEETLLWGRPNPRMPRRKDGLWIAHGHTVVPEVQIQKGRIALDTGAVHSGVLSAARLETGAVHLLSVGSVDR